MLDDSFMSHYLIAHNKKQKRNKAYKYEEEKKGSFLHTYFLHSVLPAT